MLVVHFVPVPGRPAVPWPRTACVLRNLTRKLFKLHSTAAIPIQLSSSGRLFPPFARLPRCYTLYFLYTHPFYLYSSFPLHRGLARIYPRGRLLMINLICSAVRGRNKGNPTDAESDKCFREFHWKESVEKIRREQNERMSRKKRWSLVITYRDTLFEVIIIYVRMLFTFYSSRFTGVHFLEIGGNTSIRYSTNVPQFCWWNGFIVRFYSFSLKWDRRFKNSTAKLLWNRTIYTCV